MNRYQRLVDVRYPLDHMLMRSISGGTTPSSCLTLSRHSVAHASILE
jgi:hypothetical protein